MNLADLSLHRRRFLDQSEMPPRLEENNIRVMHGLSNFNLLMRTF
jgi:hypothetical protein